MSENNGKLTVDNKKMDIYVSNEITQPNKRAFLAAIAETGNITSAAKITGIARKTHYNWMQEDSAYAAAYKEAMEQAAENLEAEARRRAVEGTLKPVFYKGKQCGTVREYSDTLLIFLLKGAMPDKYSEKFQGTIDHNVIVDDMSREQIQERIAELLSKKQMQQAIDADYQIIDDTGDKAD